jgi:hypothetical protein
MKVKNQKNLEAAHSPMNMFAGMRLTERFDYVGGLLSALMVCVLLVVSPVNHDMDQISICVLQIPTCYLFWEIFYDVI